MNEKKNYIYILSSLAFLIPPPGRFVYGLTLCIELNLLILAGTSVTVLIKKIGLEKILQPLTMIVLISITILFRQIMVLTQTEIALVLDFYFYLPTVSSFMISSIFTNENKFLSERLKYNMKNSCFLTVIALCFYLFRDIFGFGTFTFFGAKHRIFEKVLFSADKVNVMTFFASIPGALILFAVLMWIDLFLQNKFRIIKNAELAKKSGE